MVRRFHTVMFLMVLSVGAGCHGSCRQAPGPAFIDRRPALDNSTARRGAEPGDDTEPLTAFRRSHPEVGRIRGRGSLSIGVSTRGFVFNARELSIAGTSHRIMAEQAGRATNFGTDELVDAIIKAGSDVAARYPGSTLPVGNLSRGGGGPLRWSLSHKSGRDADLGFYLRGPDGTQVFQSSMTSIGRDGLTVLEGGVTAMFDAPRTWAMVKSLLNNRKISVQWIFMADHLKKRLIDHARAHREPAALISRADQAIAQPRGLNHDDHIHLRIYCQADDLLEGCRDSGSNRPWYSPPGSKLARRNAELIRLTRSKDASTRRDAIEVLGHFGERGSVRVIATRLRDDDIGVRRAAAEAVAWVGISGVELLVVAAILDPVNPDDLVDRLLMIVETTVPAASRRNVLESLATARRTLTVDNGVFITVSDVGQRAMAGLAAFQ